MGLAVGDDVKFAEGGRVGIQCLLRNDEPVTVIIDVGEAYAVVARSEHAELPALGGFQQVGQEEIVARTVHLMRRHGHRHEVVAARLGDFHLGHGLRGSVGLHVLFQRQLWHFVFGESVDVDSREARGGGGAEDYFVNAMLLCRLDDVSLTFNEPAF